MNLPPKPNIVYMKTTKDKEKGVKITTSVSVSDMKDSVPTITFQLTHELLSEHLSDSSASLSEILKSKGFRLKLKLEMKERMEPDRSAVENDFHFTYGDDCKDPPPTAESLERPPEDAWTSRDARSSGQTQEDARLPASKTKDGPDVSQYFSEEDFGSGGHGPAPSISPHLTRTGLRTKDDADRCGRFPPTEQHRPRLRSTALDGPAFSTLHHTHFHPASTDEAGKVFSAAQGTVRPQGDTSCPKRKSWIQDMGAEQRGGVFPMKRCHTFPGISEALGMMQEEIVLPYQGCVLSLIINSLSFNTVRLGNIHQEKIRRSSLGSRRPQRPLSTWSSNSEVPEYHQDTMICHLNPHGRQTISRYRRGNVKLGQEGRQGKFSEEADGWFLQDPRPGQLPEKLRHTQVLCQPVKPGEHQDGASVPPQPVAAEHPRTFPPAGSAQPDEDTHHLLRDTENGEGEQKQEVGRSSSGSAAISADKQEEKLTKMDQTSPQSTPRCEFRSCSASIPFACLTHA